jgi:hypothetical protein
MWLATTTPQERRALWAAYGGYGLDGFDFMVYSFIVPTLLTVWGLTKAEAGVHRHRHFADFRSRRMGGGNFG